MCFRLLQVGFVFLGICLFASCEEVIEPSLITADPILVVEGHISDSPGETFIKLTNTTSFNTPEPNPTVRGASVHVRADSETSIVFTETSLGRYTPLDPNFVGTQGVAYSLSVRVEANTYTAEARMPYALTIDSLSYTFEPARLDQPEGYYVSYHYQDPLSKDFHRVQLWNNGEEVIEEKFDIYNDNNVNGKYLQFTIPKAFQGLDTVTMRASYLTENAYKYFEGLNLLVESGSPSQAVPENPPTNISSATASALGFFYASSSSVQTIIIEP